MNNTMKVFTLTFALLSGLFTSALGQNQNTVSSSITAPNNLTQEVRVTNLSTKRTTDQVYNLRQEQRAALQKLQNTSEEANVILDEGLSYLAQQGDRSLDIQGDHYALLQQHLDQNQKNAWSWWEVAIMMLLGILLLAVLLRFFVFTSNQAAQVDIHLPRQALQSPPQEEIYLIVLEEEANQAQEASVTSSSGGMTFNNCHNVNVVQGNHNKDSNNRPSSQEALSRTRDRNQL